MRHPIHIYASAFAELLADEPKKYDAYLERFMSILERNGDGGAAKKILGKARELLIQKSGGRRVVLESARPLSDHDLNRLSEYFSARDSIETSINPEILGGVKIMIGGEQIIDASLERKLKKLFAEI